MKKNVFKPRYKIAYLAKNKIWYYKDSRLRRFFNIRGKKLIRRGLFKRYFLVFNNMKWTIARRYIRPFMRRRAAVKRRYKVSFYNKQQLRHFYGKIKEKSFRKFFQNHMSSVTARNNSFYSALERRADMFLFRTRLLPTIYAANQFVHHQGIEINGKIEKSPNALVRPGTLLSFNTKYWSTFSDLLCDRVYFRLYGIKLWEKRAYTRLKKKVRWLSKLNRFRRKNEFLILKKLMTLRKRVQPLLERFVENYLNSVLNWERVFYAQYNQGNFSINELKEFILSAKGFKIKLSDLVDQLKTMRYTVQKTRNVSKNTFYVKNLVKQPQIFKEAYLNSSLQGKIADQKTEKDYTHNLFNQRYKKLYYNYFGLKNEQAKNFSFRWKGSYSKFFKLISLLSDFYLGTLNLFLSANLWELDLKSFILKKSLKVQKNNIIDTATKDYNMLILDALNFARKKRIYLTSKSELLKTKIQKMLEPFIKRKIRYKLWTSGKNLGNSSNKVLKRSPLYYFLIYRRLKKARRLSVPRLKSVHWYIPSYIHFDFKTMQAVFLHHPLPEEIFYSFKCSLPKITSFYKSRGY